MSTVSCFWTTRGSIIATRCQYVALVAGPGPAREPGQPLVVLPGVGVGVVDRVRLGGPVREFLHGDAVRVGFLAERDAGPVRPQPLSMSFVVEAPGICLRLDYSGLRWR